MGDCNVSLPPSLADIRILPAPSASSPFLATPTPPAPPCHHIPRALKTWLRVVSSRLWGTSVLDLAVNTRLGGNISSISWAVVNAVNECSHYSEYSESSLHLTLANPGEGLHWEISARNTALLGVETKFVQKFSNQMCDFIARSS